MSPQSKYRLPGKDTIAVKDFFEEIAPRKSARGSKPKPRLAQSIDSSGWIVEEECARPNLPQIFTQDHPAVGDERLEPDLKIEKEVTPRSQLEENSMVKINLMKTNLDGFPENQIQSDGEKSDNGNRFLSESSIQSIDTDEFINV